MTNQEMIEDEIYIGYLDFDKIKYIFKGVKGGGYKSFIYNELSFHTESRPSKFQWPRLEQATELEKNWFRACEKAGKFVPQPKDEIINDFQIY